MYHGSISKVFKRTHAFTRIFSLLMHGNCVKSFITFLYLYIMYYDHKHLVYHSFLYSSFYALCNFPFNISSFFFLSAYLKDMLENMCCVGCGGGLGGLFEGYGGGLGGLFGGCGGGLGGLFYFA